MGHSGLQNSADETEPSALMKKAQDGDGNSYALLLKKVQVMLCTFVNHSFTRLGLKNYGGQEDVVQEILLAIHKKRATFDRTQFFLPWMYAIARYKVIDYFRQNKKHVYASVSLSTEEQIMAFDIAVITEFGTKHDLQSLCQLLPDKQRTILELVKLEGLSIEEVGHKTGYSASDIKISIHRALKFLQQKVQSNE